MGKPVLLTVDDDREVLRAIERDLRRKYGSDYRVLLTAYAETDAAIAAINEAGINFQVRLPIG